MSDDTVQINTKGLEQLIKAFRGNMPMTKVGIVGDKNARTGAGQTNAEIGYRHEFGVDVPQRSFLRMPLTLKLNEYLEKNGAFDKDALAKVIKEGSIVNWVKKVGITGEEVVADAFDSGGFGQWLPSNMDHKKVKMTLVETQQLRDSISSIVTEGS